MFPPPYNMAKTKKIDTIIRKFASKVFEIHPEMMGLNICGVAVKEKHDKLGDLRIRGTYIENKNFKDTEDKK